MPKVFWVFVTPTETRDLIFPWTRLWNLPEPPPDKITGWVTLDWDTWLGSNPMVRMRLLFGSTISMPFRIPMRALIKAFANKDPLASYALGEIFTSDEVRPDLVPDFTFAAKHYEQASQGGYLPASVQYALFKQHEIVDPQMAIEKDVVEGINLLKQAARSKLPSGYHYLGRSYFKGIGVEVDQEMALVNFRAAADRGYAISQLAVAEFFAYGVAGPPKVDLALRYARRALEQEEERAMSKIAEYELLLKEDQPVVESVPVPAISAPPPPIADDFWDE